MMSSDANILTFDIEDWYHILDNDPTKTEKEWLNYEYRLEANMEKIFELFDRNNQKATFFVLGWVAQKYPNLVKKIDMLGYEIASHSHLHQLVYEQKPNEFKIDLEKSIKTIEDITGKKITIYRAPGFSLTEKTKWAFYELVNEGIEIDCSIFPANRSHGGAKSLGIAEPTLINVNGHQIKELPINMYKIFGFNFVFSGGGYFRLVPYWIIKLFMKNSNYVMSYFHPRDFDYTQPILKNLSRLRRFKSYYGLKGSLHKIEKLIKDFKFIDIKTANDLIDWNSVKVIDLN